MFFSSSTTRTRPLLCIGITLLQGGQNHRELREASLFGRHFDSAAMRLDDLLRDREPQARSAGRGREKRDEKLLEILAFDSDSVVLDRKNGLGAPAMPFAINAHADDLVGSR